MQLRHTIVCRPCWSKLLGQTLSGTAGCIASLQLGSLRSSFIVRDDAMPLVTVPLYNANFIQSCYAALHMTNAGGAKVGKLARKTDARDTDTVHDLQDRLKKSTHDMLMAK